MLTEFRLRSVMPDVCGWRKSGLLLSQLDAFGEICASRSCTIAQGILNFSRRHVECAQRAFRLFTLFSNIAHVLHGKTEELMSST